MSETPGIPSFTPAGEPSGSTAVPAEFAGPSRAHAVWLAVTRQMANARPGTHQTKTRGEVSGGGKKPWKQKHTGRARQGSTRSPQWRHGAVIFGPRPRKYSKHLPEQVRKLAMRGAIADKVRSGLVMVLGGLDGLSGTKSAAALLKKVGAERGALVILPSVSVDAARAFRNIPGVRVDVASAASVYDILKYHHVIFVNGALDMLAKRCGGEA